MYKYRLFFISAVVATLTLPQVVLSQTRYTLENTVFGSREYSQLRPRYYQGMFAEISNDFVNIDEYWDCRIDNEIVAEYLYLSALLEFAGKSGDIDDLHWLTPSELWTYVYSDEALYRIDLKTRTVTDSIIGVLEGYDLSAQSGFAAYGNGDTLWIGTPTKTIQVNKIGQRDVKYGTSVHREEFGIEKGTFWSPDGLKLAFYRMDESMVEDYPQLYIDSDCAFAYNIKYPKAGETSHEVSVGVIEVSTERMIYLQTASPVNRYFTNIAWSPDSKYILVAEINREQNHLWLNVYDAETGELYKTLFEESNNEWVEQCTPPLFIDNTRFAWLSERDGYRHIYLYDIRDASCKQLTSGNYCVIDLYAYSAKQGKIFFSSNERGYLYKDTYSVTLDAIVSRLTDKAGWHDAVFSSSGEQFLDYYSAPDIAFQASLVNTADKESKLIYDKVNPYEDFVKPEIRTVELKSADGKQSLTGRVILPVDFDDTKKYPTIIYVYGGPHNQLVTADWLYGADPWMLYFAQQGYIVYSMDNRGTENRGVEFEHIVHRHLGQCEMNDQYQGIEYLLSLPYVDKDRIGVQGWSYGGFMTISLMLKYNDILKCGVAGGPVTDWHLYEVMYGERYMDTPQENPEGYEQTSTLNKIGQLQGRLLVIHGSEDPIVIWQNSLLLLKRSVEEGVDIDYAVYPGHEHNVNGPDRVHLIRKIFNYFEDHLKK